MGSVVYKCIQYITEKGKIVLHIFFTNIHSKLSVVTIKKKKKVKGLFSCRGNGGDWILPSFFCSIVLYKINIISIVFCRKKEHCYSILAKFKNLMFVYRGYYQIPHTNFLQFIKECQACKENLSLFST